MRYRLMATYQGVPYEAGVGPTGADVVLFAACPPPEELGFEPAPGHWRKRVVRAEIDALWESRPVGIFRGEPCIVLDDLGDRLHIAYLGTDPGRAALLGYWQVDRGVFELLAPRDEITGLAEERVERPLRWSSTVLHAGTPPAYPYGTAPWPAQASQPPDGPVPVLSEWRAPSPGQAPAVNGTAPGQRPPGYVNGSRPPADPPGYVNGSRPPADPPGYVNGSRPPADPLGGGSGGFPSQPAPLPPDPRLSPLDPPASAFPAERRMPPADGPGTARDEPVRRPDLNGSGHGPGLTGSSAVTGLPPGGLSPDGSPPAYGGLPLDGDPPGNGSPPASGSLPGNGSLPGQDSPPASGSLLGNGSLPGQDSLRADAVPGREQLPLDGHLPVDGHLPLDGSAPWRGTGPQERLLPPQAAGSYQQHPWDTGPGQPVPPPGEPAAGPPAYGGPAADGSRYAGGGGGAGSPPPPGQSPRNAGRSAGSGAARGGGSRSARRQRVTTRAMFSELADLAAIPRHTYALETETDGAMCLLATGNGYEVFLAADGARHEVRAFADEEAAYFYLFGVLMAEAIRNGSVMSR